MDENTFIYREGMIADTEYVSWLAQLKRRFYSAQARATMHVNSEMLGFYWNLGRDIVQMQAESKWGTGFFNQLSLDLRKAFNVTGGFSVTNLKYMKRWYSFYSEANVIRQQPVDEFGMPSIFASLPWGHHVSIITKCRSAEEAIFYMQQTIDGNWSRRVLEAEMKDDLYERTGKAITNFKQHLPIPQSQLAQEVLKDPYNFEFLTMRKGYDESELEDALVKNITHFLLELGQGFAFVGRQMELRMSNGKSFFPDLVFYHTRLKAYVVVELKVVDFIPEFAGKLNFYVSAADELLKGEDDNPSIGLLLCKSSDKTMVEWSLRDIQKPLGVATYQLQEVVERTVRELGEEKNRETDKDKK